MEREGGHHHSAEAWMRRFLCTVKKWDTMTALQLRDELARRGLKRAGTKADLIERLTKSEESPPAKAPAVNTAKSLLLDPLKPQEVKEEPQVNTDEVLPEVHLNSLSKSFLFAEITKRKPKEAVSVEDTKKKLVETLQQLVKQERIDIFCARDVRSLLVKMNSSNIHTSLEEVLDVLKGVVNIETIPQNDFSVLVHCENSSFFKLWRLIYSSAPALSPSALQTVLSTMHLFRFTLKKNCSSGKISDDMAGIERICQRTVELQGEMQLQEFVNMIQVLSQFSQVGVIRDTVSTLRSSLMARLEREKTSLSALHPNTLVSLFASLPENAYNAQKSAIDHLIFTIFNEKKVMLYQREALNFFYELVRTNTPVPRSVMLSLGDLGKDALYGASPQHTTKVLRLLCERRALSERTAHSIIKILSYWYNDYRFLHFFWEMIKAMGENGYLPILFKNSMLLHRLLNHEEKIDLPTKLKLCNILCPYVENERLVFATLYAVDRAMNEERHMELYLKDADTLLKTLLATLPERPLYDYQYLSFSTFDRGVRKELVYTLAKLLFQSEMVVQPGMLAYMASPLCTRIPENLDWSLLKREQSCDYFIALRKFHQSVPDYTEKVLAMVRQVAADMPTFEELFRASEFCQLEVSVSDMSTFAMQKQIHQIALRAVSEIGKGAKKLEYVLPTLYTLGVHEKKGSDIFEILTKHVVPSLHFRSLFGQLLYFNLIYVSQTLQQPQLVLEGLNNLTFVQKDELVTPALACSLICCLANLHQQYPFDLQLLLPFIKVYSLHFDEETTIRSAHLLKPLSEYLPLAVKSSLQQAKTVESNVDISELASLKRRRVFKRSAVLGGLQLLETATERSSVLAVIESLLEYGAVVGNTTSLLPALLAKLDKFELWNELRLKPLTNLLFLHLGTKTGKANVRPKLLELFAEKTAISNKDEDGFVINPVNGLQSLLPFNHNSVLEPRNVVANLKENLIIDPEGTSSLQDLGDEDFSQRLYSVFSGFKLPFPSDTDLVPKKRHYAPSPDPLASEFIQIMHNITKDKIFQQYQDPASGWTMDIAVPASKLGVLLYEKDDLLFGRGEDEAILIIRVMKEQLSEHGWKVEGVQRRTWNNMSLTEKDSLVRFILTKTH